VRDLAVNDLSGTLRKVKEMGYDYVELSDTYDMDAPQFKRFLDDIGLKAISAHVQRRELENDVADTVAKYKSLGCEHIVLGSLPPELLPGGKGCAKELLQNFCEECKKAGITPAYHNQVHEFKKLPDGMLILDRLFADVPNLYTQFDTGWVTIAGQNPEMYLQKYAGRCPTIHLKDVIETYNNYEDRPLGKGSQSMHGIIQAALAAGTRIFIVELDRTYLSSSLEAADESRKYLKSLGY